MMLNPDDLIITRAAFDQLAALYKDTLIPLLADLNDTMRNAKIDETTRAAVLISITDMVMSQGQR